VQTQVFGGKALLAALISLTGASTPVNLGALTAGHILAGVIHVLTPPGIAGTLPTLAPVLQSAAAVGFSSPTTRHTFTTYAAIPGFEYFEIDGDVAPISDAWFRLNNTVGGTGGPAYSIIAAIAIGVKGP
jgi:hypothetical protein